MPLSAQICLLLLALAQLCLLLRPAYGQLPAAMALLSLLCAGLAGWLTPIAALPALGGWLLALLSRQRADWRPWLLPPLGLLALALATHQLPGWHNPQLAAPALIGNGSVAYGLQASFDKGFAGLLLLLAWPPASPTTPRLSLRHALLLAPLLAALMLLTGWSCGLVSPDFKLHPLLPAFLFCNLFLTVIPEQAFFQGLLARGLLLKLPLPAVMVLIALLFAALHQGPPLYLLLTALAALAHTLLFGLSSRLLPGIAAHWLMNVGHFILFTYPR